jgi:hypothetical protein
MKATARRWGLRNQRVSREQWELYDSWRASYPNLKLARERGIVPPEEIPCDALLDYYGRSWWAGTYFEQITGTPFDKFVGNTFELEHDELMERLLVAKEHLNITGADDFQQVFALLFESDEIARMWHLPGSDADLRLAAFHVYVRGALRLYGHPLTKRTAGKLLIRILADPTLALDHGALLNDSFLPDLCSSCVVVDADGSVTRIRELDESAWTAPKYRAEMQRG